MGSRFGGMKQITPMGPNGEIMIDFSVYDAVEAGFNKIVMVIKKENEREVREVIDRRISKMVEVEYVYQSPDTVPEGFSVPEGRTKPWGTGHALYCCKGHVDTPFGIINADDFYGKESYKILHEHLVQSEEMCIVGFRLGQTLTENGSVSRGICTEKNGYLTGVTEIKAITKDSDIPSDSVCSMNMWGLRPEIFERTEEKFSAFLKNIKNPLTDEFYLPFFIDEQIHERNVLVKVLSTPEKWFGVTYKEDAPSVKKAMTELIEKGLYKGL